MQDFTAILHAIGLLDSEIKTYISSLENGPSSVIDLTKLTKLSRQAVYVAIESLAKRGLMSSALSGKKRLYAAEPPEKLLSYARRRDAETHQQVQDLERLVPELELRAGGEKPVVKVFEGKSGIMAIVEDMRMGASKETFEITDLEAMFKVLSVEDLQTMRNELAKKGTYVHGIYSGTPQGGANTTVRHFLPSELAGFKSNIGIYGNKIALVTFEGKMHSVIIESEHLTKTLRILFDLAFKGMEKTL